MRALFDHDMTRPRALRSMAARISLAMMLLAACDTRSQLHGVMIEPPRDVPAFEFTLASGARWRTGPESDRPMVVFFGYTHCPDICPTTLADWKRARSRLGTAADRVRFVFVTVDPERDTPAIADAYAKQFDPSFVGVSGDSATTTDMLKAYGATAAREPSVDPRNYLVGHTASAFLVDGQSRLLAMYPPGIGWEALADDLKTVLK
jgi:protein SCO1/2